ncbi:hypothetical protein CEXT_678051 [Caerostris extrusa]|uniref:4Fe-4S ferredoxin-type domain-containing protein n=1 Tax=Caerostris extrusa TaxID=172846 RepID=A0AAV4VZH3_CAEEX|nr:hypothetical protein CEXT_678051 [Caerostris extrusa]
MLQFEEHRSQSVKIQSSPQFRRNPINESTSRQTSVDKYRGRILIPQCRGCYGFLYSSENCYLKIHCGLCVEYCPTENAPSKQIRTDAV